MSDCAEREGGRERATQRRHPVGDDAQVDPYTEILFLISVDPLIHCLRIYHSHLHS